MAVKVGNVRREKERKSSESSGAHQHEKRLGAPGGRTVSRAGVRTLREERNWLSLPRLPARVGGHRRLRAGLGM